MGAAGRCRTRIGPIYPAVELATAVLLAGCLFAFGLSLHAAAAAVFCAALVVITATDLTHRIVPNVVVLPAAAVVLALMTAAEPSPEWAIAGARRRRRSCSSPRSPTRAEWAWGTSSSRC